TLFANTDGGIYKSLDNGHSWSDLSAGISVMQFYDFSVFNNSFIGGTQDNGCNEGSIGNTQFHNISGGDGFDAIWHTGDHSIKFLSDQNSIIRRQFGSNLFIFEDPEAFWFTKLSCHNNDPGILFATKSKNQLIRGNQTYSGAFPWDWSWYSTGTQSLLVEQILSYAQAYDNANIMYVVNGTKIIKTLDVYAVPAPWTELDKPNPDLLITDVVVDPNNSNRVWISCGGFANGQKIFKSENGGTTWTNISGSLPNIPIRCMKYGPPGSDIIYIGTEIGVFFKNATMTDWIFFSNNLPNNIVTDIEISGNYVYVSTFGRGIWRSTIYESCPYDLSLTQANDPATTYFNGKQVHNASNNITNSRVLNGSLGVDATYIAGNAIDFVEGFWAKTNSIVLAKNEGCPD
ncbi:MAG: hypothetical protein RLZZ546_185, partial [Bacteroidota bacterium]